MKKIKVFIDFPISHDGKFRGLSAPQYLYDYLKQKQDVELVGENDSFDIIFVANGASHYSSLNRGLWQRILAKTVFRKRIDFKFLAERNFAYEKKLTALLQKNPQAKIIHRLDDRYKILCKNYGYDETVAWINQRAAVTVYQTEYNRSLYEEEQETIFGKLEKLTVNNGVVIPNAVDRGVFNELGERYDFPGKYKILHVAATGMTRKGLGTVLGFAELLKDNEEIKFYLVGRQSSDPIYGARIAQYPNVKQLPFTEERRELAKIYRSMDVLLFPSLKDCSPNVVLEAMSCGLPVLAVDSGGTPELILKKDIQGGVLIDPENPIYSLKAILENLPAFRANAIALVKKYHDLAVMGEYYYRIIKQLMNDEPPL